MMTVNDVITKLMEMDPSTPCVISSATGDYFYPVNSLDLHMGDGGAVYCLVIAGTNELEIDL